MRQTSEVISESSDKTWKMFLLMLLYKIALDYGFWKLLVIKNPYFVMDFNLTKFFVGFIWCTVLFWAIDHNKGKASTFFLYFIFLFQIVPITTLYALRNENSLYYTVLCFSFLVCLVLVRYVKTGTRGLPNPTAMMLFNRLFTALTVVLLAGIFLKNGLPTLTALNIYDVYELRASGTFEIGKYMGYILSWVAMFYMPFVIAQSANKKRFVIMGLASFVLFVIYLYTGQKTYLFSIFVCVICSLLSTITDFYYKFYKWFCTGIAALTGLVAFVPILNKIWTEIYSLIVRRTLIVPANLKFVHYDYFTNHPKFGLYGVIPQAKIISIPDYYRNIRYPFDIGRIYFDAPNMSSDTGALAEGYMRFGFPGILFVFLLIALIIIQIDRIQDKTNYSLAVSLFILPIYSLAESQLISSMILGFWMFWIIVPLFIHNKDELENSI